MTNPTPEAVGVVAAILLKCRVDDDAPVSLLLNEGDRTHIAWVVLTELRDAIHRDGPDADAIRETLGLRRAVIPLVKGGTHTVVMGEWTEVHP